MKQRKQFALILMLGLLVTSCGVSRKVEKVPTPTKTVEILAVNDMHAAIDNFPRFAYMVDSLRALYPDMLLFSGGDNQTGNPVNDQYAEKGMPMIELMNALHFDLSAIGNHEFDSKPDGFLNNLQKARFDFLCANFSAPEGSVYPIRPYKIITLPNGIRLAVTSLLNINETGIPDTHPDNARPFSFGDPLQKAREMLFLRDSCDLFIFLNHYGFEEDVQLANQLPHGVVDLIIGGHSHTKIDTEQIHNDILITQAERKLKYATLIKLRVHPDGKVERSMQLLTVGKKGSTDPTIAAMVDAFNNNPALKVAVAEATAQFNSYEQLGYLMADALRAGTQTEIAIINFGGVRMDRWDNGAICVRDVYELDPFGNEMVIFQLTGKELLGFYECAFGLDEQRPILGSGVVVHYLVKPDKSLKKVELFTPDGAPIDPDKVYKVGMSSYMATAYPFRHDDPGTGLFRTSAENMIDYLREMRTIPDYRQEKRVTIEVETDEREADNIAR